MQENFVKLTDTLCLANNVIIAFPSELYNINEEGPNGKEGLLATADYILEDINKPFAPYGDDTVHKLKPDKTGTIHISPSHISSLPQDIQQRIREARNV